MTDAPATILVTGAVGFVGRHLLAALQARQPQARIVAANRGDAPGGFPLEQRVFEITDAAACEAAIRDVVPTAVVHLAAIAAPAKAAEGPALAWDVNVQGTINLARAVLRHAPRARFLFVSSSEVYGRQASRAGLALSERAAIGPDTVYGATKACADLLIGEMAAMGLDAVRFRPFNHSGPGQLEDFVLPAFARQIALIEQGRQPPVIEVGNLEAERDFLDVRDVVAAYALALEQPALPVGAVFNLASGRPRAISSLLERLLAMSDLKIEVRVDPARLRPVDVPRIVGDASAAGAMLGWKPAIAIETMLADILADWRMRVAAA